MPYPADTLYPSDALYPGDEEEAVVYPRIAVTREYPPDKLALKISDPKTGETISRWAADEPLAENVIDGLRKSGEMPGGHKELTGVLARNPRTPWPDLAPYLDVSLYGPGVEEVWAGRLDKPPESDGDRMAIEPAAVGHQKALEDNKALIGPGFIDADQSKWGDPSTQRRLKLLENLIYLMASTSQGLSSLAPAGALPAIINDFTNVEAAEGKNEAGEADYDSGGVDIGEVRYDHDVLNAPDGGFDSNMAIGKTDTFDIAVVGTDHNGAVALDQRVEAPGPGYRFARLRDLYSGAFTGSMTNVFAWHPRVIGTHNLTPQGTWPNIGFTAAQMLAYAIPLYTYLTVDQDEIEDDGYVIPHAWFSDPGMMAQVVAELTKYGLLDWFVLVGKRFQLRWPGTYGRKWQAYSGPSELKDDGKDGSRLWREITVRWHEGDGRTRTIGPLGSGATLENAALEITDPDHPAVRADIVRRDLLDLKAPSNAKLALESGERWLEDANQLSHSGSCVLSGYILDDCGIWRPASQVQPGDHVRFPDAPDKSYRKIVYPDYEHDPRKATCALDAPPEGVQALLERYVADLIPLGFS